MGPLHGLKVVELAGIGPGPMAAMLLADMGATVIRVDRKVPSGLGVQRPERFDLLLRNRRGVPLDLKDPAAVALVLQMVDKADVLIEGFRPGVTERMGLGPDVCLKRNPKLIYGRITGWGQSGPMAQVPGHDINFLALTGALHAMGRAGQAPTPPINLVADFGGGTLYLVMGILAALHESKTSGLGQVVDTAMVDGVASLMTQPHGSHAAGLMGERGTNPTDSGAPFYEAYRCADGEWVAVGAVETKFYAELLRVLALDSLLAEQWNRSTWGASKTLIAAKFAQRTRAQWCDAFEGLEACFSPVLSITEAPLHPHLQERATYVAIDGVVQPAPAPRFGRSVPAVPLPFRPWKAQDSEEILSPWLTPQERATARRAGLVE
jgi:alpha-methylacyl-CoA racemase